MLDQKLLDILACPTCRGPVTPDAGHAWLTCGACGVRYRVEGNIPIMLPDEAEKIGGTDAAAPAADDR
ncbi:Trm112 family protein [bacterium]|nr:Trm112 family protein [bacterium]